MRSQFEVMIGMKGTVLLILGLVLVGVAGLWFLTPVHDMVMKTPAESFAAACSKV